MISNLIIRINNKYLDKYLLFILITTILLSIAKINVLPISLPIDAYGYFSFSDNLFNQSEWQSRPFGYPLFLKINRIVEFFGLSLIIIFQLIVYIITSSLIYISFKKYDKNFAFIFSLIFSLTPAFQWITINTLADALYAFFPIFVIFFIFRYFEKKKALDFFLIFLLAFITSVLRPSYIVFFYIIIFLNIFLFFKKKKFFKINISFVIKVIISSLVFLFIFENMNSKFSKNYSFHQLWIWNISTSMCDEKKCFNINNGIHAKKYFETVTEILNKDKDFKKALSSNYDYKDAPKEINEKLYNTKSEDLIQIIHNSTSHTPFVHIYGFMVNNIGFENTHKIIRNISFETFYNNPSMIIRNLFEIYKFENFFNLNLKNSSQHFKEGMYFAIIPKPYYTLEDQGMTHLENIKPKEYAQMIYGLEKFTGQTIKKYNKNKKKFYDLYNKIDDYSFVKNKYVEDKNYAFLILYGLAFLNLFFLIFYKLFILIIIPIFSFSYFFIKLIYGKLDILEYIYFFSLLMFYSIFLIIAVLTPLDIDRQINLNLGTLYPLIIIFFINIKKIYNIDR